jgi:hypothetical protein
MRCCGACSAARSPRPCISHTERPLTVARKRVGQHVGAYRYPPEMRLYGLDGRPAGKPTVGLLQRRPVASLEPPAFIGKDANALEAVSVGLVETEVEVLNRHADPDHSVWSELVRPVLADMLIAELRRAVGNSRRRLSDVAKAPTQPRAALALALTWAAVRFARTPLGVSEPATHRLPEHLQAVSLGQRRVPRRALAILARYLEPCHHSTVSCQVYGPPIPQRSRQHQYSARACRLRAWRLRRQAV